MTWTSVIIFLAIGLAAGWLAGIIWRGGGFGLAWNLIIGVVGAFLGGWIFSLLQIPHYGIIGMLVSAVVGALILLAIINLVRRR